MPPEILWPLAVIGVCSVLGIWALWRAARSWLDELDQEDRFSHLDFSKREDWQR